MVDQSETDVISWSETGNSFIVAKVDALETLLPLFFSHANFLSFVRQLNFYGQFLRDEKDSKTDNLSSIV